ncbi:MAG TPA: prepilin-type N-terminal cleavage/methylation domain-containing protein [Vicinamibacterales bacterium]|jgi:prepilin-type N-terminal cleavage/methylation domain-containing protein
MALAKSNSSSNAGFSLLEVLVATALLASALVSLAQLFAMSTKSNIGSRNTTYAAVLAQQKLEELRSLAWGFDQVGLPISDITTDTTVTPETPAGGTGLSPSPSTALQNNTPGWVDFIDAFGNKVLNPGDALYARRWMVSPLPTNPNNTLVIQVLVYRVSKDRGAANAGAVSRLPEEARMITVKTRKAR